MAPTSSEKGLLAAMAEEARPSWDGAKAAAEATREARIIDFMVGYRIVLLGMNEIMVRVEDVVGDGCCVHSKQLGGQLVHAALHTRKATEDGLQR
jgi:hypothetical protein